MNSLPPREDVENHASTKTCFYCKKVFDNYQALGGHLRIHQLNGLLKTGSFSGHLSNSSENSRMYPVSVPNSQQQFSSGLAGDHLTSFTRTTFPFGLPRKFCKNELNQADMSNFTGNNPRFARIPSILSQSFSYGSIANINYLSSCVSATASASLPRMAFALSGTGSSSDLSSNLGSNAISQFNTDNNFWTCQDGLPSSPLEYYQGHNSGPNLCFSVSKCQGSVLTGDKRSFFGEGSAIGSITNVSKKQKNISGLAMESGESRKKELPLFVDADDTIYASEALSAETKGQADVDLSLHL
ncbi:hypothetical protein SLEP1_g45030 [Rubroshorea leprosula]|uniref:C2H2-type domain-containing protein n=1 Tax=Rubroshorea leprosula TaxID=152421 RepID=A0AAV5LJB7_9ROSI|nr:hypothetical protein SLEP1_g45030 [Rubroshorea leprosula]